MSGELGAVTSVACTLQCVNQIIKKVVFSFCSGCSGLGGPDPTTRKVCASHKTDKHIEKGYRFLSDTTDDKNYDV